MASISGAITLVD